MKKISILLVIIAIVLIFPVVLLHSEDEQSIEPGKVINKVVCRDKPQYSYACYLPTNYTPKKKWPILYCFSHNADGPGYIDVFYGACEEAKWIIVCSNDFQDVQGGPIEPEPIKSMWQDTQKRFSVDTDEVYVSGFSDGARVATMFADDFKAKGHIAIGGIYPRGSSDLPKMFYWLMCGRKDFNLPEMQEATNKIWKMKCPIDLRFFPGGHIMPSKDLAQEAVKWMNDIKVKVRRNKFACDMERKEKIFVCADCKKFLDGYQCGDCKKKFGLANDNDRKCPECGSKKLSPIKLVEDKKCFFCQSANIKEQLICIKEVYTCPDHPDETSTRIGKCPQCKKTLEFKEKVYSKIIVNYWSSQCGYTQDTPGTCPGCNQALQKQTKCEMSGIFPHSTEKQ